VVVAGPTGEIALGGAQRRLILALLLAARQDGCSTDELVDALWGGHPPPASMTVLHAAISRLRKLLEPDRAPRAPATVIRSTARGYALDLDGHAVDEDRFADLVESGRTSHANGDPAAAKDRLTEAVALWRGPAYGDLADHPAPLASAAELEEARLTALEWLAEARLRLGEHDDLVGVLETRVRRHPYRERSWAQLMLALYRSGRQADALSAYQRCRRRLIEELGIEPGPALHELNRAILLQQPELGRFERDQVSVGTDLPTPRTTFVGRELEAAELVDAIKAHRLVTVTGPAGVGKTRLAVDVARRCQEGFHHGSAYCELVPDSPATTVRAAVAAAVGTSDTDPDRLVDHLRTRELLLVIDNADHAIAGTAELTDRLLAGCGRLRILATSRAPLGAYGERLVRLAPLAHDDPADAACTLFRDRAALVAPAGSVDDDAVLTACRRLGGLPLAIELAAARLRSMPMDRLVAGLDERLSAITGAQLAGATGRGSLRDILEWSIEPLDAEHRALLRRLAVFAGGCDAGAAATVCRPGCDVEPALAELVDRSLVELEMQPDGARYHLLPPIRADGLARLEETGELDAVSDRHLDWCLSLAPEAPGHGEDPAVVGRLAFEAANVEAALARGFERASTSMTSRLAVTATPMWIHLGHFDDARRWLERAAESSGSDPGSRQSTLWWLGWVLARQGAFAEARRRLEEALAIAVVASDPEAEADTAVLLAGVEIESGDPVGGEARLSSFHDAPDGASRLPRRVRHKHALGIRALQTGELDRAVSLLDDAAAEARVAGMWHTLVRVLTSLAQSESGRRHDKRADGALAEGLALARRHQLIGLMPRLLGVQAILHGRRGDWNTARSMFEHAVAAARTAGDRRVEVISLINLGVVDLREDRPMAALERLEEADSLARAAGDDRDALMIAPILAEAVVFGTHDTVRALALLRHAVARAEDIGIPTVTIPALEAAALALVDRDGPGDLADAAAILGACAAAREELDFPEDTARNSPLDRARVVIRDRLGNEAADAAIGKGREQGLAAKTRELLDGP
jgi:predicted ATPase/DNA-binding SARP family transcriptional activator